MDDVRALIKAHLDYPLLLDRIGDHEDLISCGVNSGEMIRIALGCEKRMGRPLTDDELTRITSVHSIAELLAQKASA